MNEHNESKPVPTAADPALAAAEAEMRRVSRRSFLWAGLATGAVVGGVMAFDRHAPDDEGTKAPLRRVLEFNQVVAQRIFFSPRHRAQEFPRSAAMTPKNNYKGDTPTIDLATWRLKVGGLSGGATAVALDELKAMPQAEQTTELKCIEGWSVVVNWSGVRFIDFAKRYPPPTDARYVAMLSEPPDFPDERYYVGLDLASCLHPQTLLATHMNGSPLDVDHGAPLRLVIPVKYGIKNIKLITSMAYMADRPTDYWYEQGYDWYAGL
jgi:DMSO/TMAO reductase YedYZ molybdopterin-dependent catalytic subunit